MTKKGGSELMDRQRAEKQTAAATGGKGRGGVKAV